MQNVSLSFRQNWTTLLWGRTLSEGVYYWGYLDDIEKVR